MAAIFKKVSNTNHKVLSTICIDFTCFLGSIFSNLIEKLYSIETGVLEGTAIQVSCFHSAHLNYFRQISIFIFMLTHGIIAWLQIFFYIAFGWLQTVYRKKVPTTKIFLICLFCNSSAWVLFIPYWSYDKFLVFKKF